MILPETLTANGVSHRDTPFAFQLRRFLLQGLNQSLLGAVNPVVARSLRQARNALRADDLPRALRHLDQAWYLWRNADRVRDTGPY